MRRQAATVAAAGALTFAATARTEHASVLELVRVLLLGATLGAIVIYDLRERRIPNRLVLPATAVCGLITGLGGSTIAQLAPALAIVAVLTIVALVRPRALGMGDAKLALLIAAALPSTGARAIVVGLTLAAAAGMLTAMSQHSSLTRKSIALAPFLAAGTLLALL